MPDYVWICLNMPEYAGICVNISKSAKYRLITEAAVYRYQNNKFWKYPRKAIAVESYFSTVTGLTISFKTGLYHGYFREKFSEQIFFM